MNGPMLMAFVSAIEHDPAERARVQALVSSAVRIRFALTSDAFVLHVLNVARALGGDAPLSETAARLSLDDLYLAAACAAGDDRAWTEFMERYRDFIHRFARRALKEADATDLADEVIADLWKRRKIGRYAGRSSLKTWLGTVVSYAAINAAKAKQVREADPNAVVPAPPDPERQIGDNERSAVLARLLADSIARQPNDDRLLMLLYYEQALTLDQIGALIGLSKAAVSRRLARIRTAVLDAANALALQRLGTSARSLASGLDLSQVELDLRAACQFAANPDSSRSLNG